MTFDILTHYGGLDEKIITMSEDLNDPQTALLLERNVRNAYDAYDWCLEPVEVGQPLFHFAYTSSP